jgi:hypothetical protein
VTFRTVSEENQLEGTTPLLEVDILDEAGVGFKPSELKLYLWDVKSGQIVNSRNGIDVLSSCDNDGHFAFWTTAEDNTMVDPVTNITEIRKALLVWKWGSSRVGAHEFSYPVENHPHLPPV